MSGDFLSRDECKVLFDTVLRLTSGGGETQLALVSRWSGAAEWARNRVSLASIRRTTNLMIRRNIRDAQGEVTTSRLDPAGLRDAIRLAEREIRLRTESPEPAVDPTPDRPILHPVLWSDGTYGFGAEARLSLAERLIDPAENANFLSAGTFRVMADGNATIGSDGMFRYYATTSVECSMTVRDAKGTASGWAGVNHFDLARIDPEALAARALEKAQLSTNPQALEPGHYTAILEPQATADLFSGLTHGPLDRRMAEMGAGPFAGRLRGHSKIGERVLDRRLVWRSDPMDPDGGFIPYEQSAGAPYQPVSWADRGILRELSYNEGYALEQMGYPNPLLDPDSYRVTAAPDVPTTTLDAMIANTTRGILVTRFSDIRVVDDESKLCRGYTRDGLWLVERGKITRALKNFRFVESPLFVLNKLLDVSAPQRVYRPG
jgi:predicted Zn-dependent protease